MTGHSLGDVRLQRIPLELPVDELRAHVSPEGDGHRPGDDTPAGHF